MLYSIGLDPSDHKARRAQEFFGLWTALCHPNRQKIHCFPTDWTVVPSWLGLIGVRHWEIMSQSQPFSCGLTPLKLLSLYKLRNQQHQTTGGSLRRGRVRWQCQNMLSITRWQQFHEDSFLYVSKNGANSCISAGPKRFFFYPLPFFLGACEEFSQRGIIECGSRSSLSEVMEPVIM